MQKKFSLYYEYHDVLGWYANVWLRYRSEAGTIDVDVIPDTALSVVVGENENP